MRVRLRWWVTLLYKRQWVLDVKCSTERDARWVGERWCSRGDRRTAVIRRIILGYALVEHATSVYLYLDGEQVKCFIVDNDRVGAKLVNELWPTSSRRTCAVIDRHLHACYRRTIRDRLAGVDFDAIAESCFRKSWKAAGVTDFAAMLKQWKATKNVKVNKDHPFYHYITSERNS